jgi:hypothetical protein
MKIIENPTEYPETYLHVEECKSGTAWIMPLRGNASLDLEKQVRAFVRANWGGELFVLPPFMPRIAGDYYAKVMTDGRTPDSVVCWDSAGFYLTSDLDEVRAASLKRS